VITLPPLLVLTDGEQARRSGRSLPAVLTDAVEGGLRALVIRERDLPDDERRRLIRWVEELLGAVDGVVMVAAPPLEAHHNVHLTASSARPAARPPVLGRSCHDADELRRAADEGCDYATLSPIFATTSKPGYGPPLGPAALGDAPLPVYALGGVDEANVAACTAAGAAGVAVMGAVMTAPDPAGTVSRLLDALGARR
jgi:thiamine-phosphate pyrophosphorylase